MAKMDVLNEVLSARFWESKSLGSLERIRLALRDLIQYMDGGTGGQTFIINVTDTFEEDNSGVNVTPIRTYRRRVEDYLKEHLSDDDALQKIYHLEPLSGQDITRLELIFWEELGSKAEFEAQTRTKRSCLHPFHHWRGAGSGIGEISCIDSWRGTDSYARGVSPHAHPLCVREWRYCHRGIATTTFQ